jgi:hypothetical protein
MLLVFLDQFDRQHSRHLIQWFVLPVENHQSGDSTRREKAKE